MMWALLYNLGEDEWEQLDLFEMKLKMFWTGPLMWPSTETDIEKVKQEFYNSLPNKEIICRVIGHYEKQGDVWQLIPLR